MNAQDGYKTIEGHAEAQIVEKKSRFITQLLHVETEEAALAFIEQVRTQHAQARHNVYAYVLRGGRARYTDDGEPAQTAGIPTYEALVHAGLVDIACVTTRYFGGVLLGTGGLVRAYTGSVQAAIEAAKVVEFSACRDVSCVVDYSHYSAAERLADGQRIVVKDAQFADKVTLIYTVAQGEQEELARALQEITSGAADPQVGEVYFGPRPVG
jgi:uncharacterized YigZ family protein